MIKITKSQTADTRSCDPKTVTKEQLRKSSEQHIGDVCKAIDFFTATTMSKEEAMALPVAERPLAYRLPGGIYHAVFEAVGKASMCWNPRPHDNVFNSEEASKVAVYLCFKIAEEIEKLPVVPNP